MPVEKLLVGFDSAWSAANQGALVGALVEGTNVTPLSPSVNANFSQALAQIQQWQYQWQPQTTWVGIDQPVIVPNERGQRPVEHILCGLISRRRGGMQPAYRAKANLFGDAAPVWSFLTAFPGDPTQLHPTQSTQVFEVYPTLLLMHLGWLVPDAQGRLRLPKYNPANTRQFQWADWQMLCQSLLAWFAPLGVDLWMDQLQALSRLERPRKADQDQVDALLCWVSVWYRWQGQAWQVGNPETGFLLNPLHEDLMNEVWQRTIATGRDPQYFLTKV